MPVEFSKFASTVTIEGAFQVLAIARRLQAQGKDVIELEIGDSPFPSSPAATTAGIAALREDRCHYGPAVGLSEFRQAASDFVNREYGLDTTHENIVAGPGAKPFEQFFCEAFLDPGDGVLVFSPHFPTYGPNIARRGARIVLSRLKQARGFRPNLDDVQRFLATDPRPKAIFLNSPHNPTGGVTTEDDLRGMADSIRGENIVVFSDEPYDRMVWRGRHHTLLRQPGMLDQCLAAYTFSKSYSMSGWRLGFAVGSGRVIEVVANLVNSALSCVPPFTQIAGIAALREDDAERDRRMASFGRKVQLLVDGLDQIDGVCCPPPSGTFYAFPSVAETCNQAGITSHGLALYLLEGADAQTGVACLGGECFGDAGGGFIRFSCAEPDERLLEAVAFVAQAFQNRDAIETYLKAHPEHQLNNPYPSDR
jgi:aspartate aminotransferase